MSLDYEFSPVDVAITTHPKAFAAGVEAMGLWLWGLAFARLHRTAGHLTRAAVLGAWGGKRNVMHAKRLVDAGLWLQVEDGGYEIFNFEAKAAGRPSDTTEGRRTSTERVRRHRELKKRNAETRFGETPKRVSETPGNVFRETFPSLSDLGSGSDLSDLGSRSLSRSSKADPDLPPKPSMRARIELDEPLRAWAAMAGAPEPTEEHLEAFRLNAQAKGITHVDELAAFKHWLIREKRFLASAPSSRARPRQPLGDTSQLPWLRAEGRGL